MKEEIVYTIEPIGEQSILIRRDFNARTEGEVGSREKKIKRQTENKEVFIENGWDVLNGNKEGDEEGKNTRVGLEERESNNNTEETDKEKTKTVDKNIWDKEAISAFIYKMENEKDIKRVQEKCLKWIIGLDRETHGYIIREKTKRANFRFEKSRIRLTNVHDLLFTCLPTWWTCFYRMPKNCSLH